MGMKNTTVFGKNEKSRGFGSTESNPYACLLTLPASACGEEDVEDSTNLRLALRPDITLVVFDDFFHN